MINAGVSTACLYPQLLEISVEKLVSMNIKHIEIFANTHSEVLKPYVKNLKQILNQNNTECVSFHPYTCPIEPMMLFSNYDRRISDFLDYHKYYFEAMNILGAKIFVFHGNKYVTAIPNELYFERFGRLAEAGREFGICVAQENVVRCQSRTLEFMIDMKRSLGEYGKFVLDVKQARRAGENPIEICEILGGSIVHIHMSDADNEHDCLPIGAGSFNTEKMIEVLQKNGFDGTIMLELYRSNFGEAEELAENYHALNKIIKGVNKKL